MDSATTSTMVSSATAIPIDHERGAISGAACEMLTEHADGGCMSFAPTDPRIGLPSFTAKGASHPPI